MRRGMMCEISFWVGGCSTGFDGCSVCGVSWELFQWRKIGVFGFVSYQSAGFHRKELLSLDTSSRIYYLHPHVISPTAALFPTAPTPLLRSSPSLLPIYTQTQTSPSPSPSPPIPPSSRQQSRNPAQEKNSLLPLEYLLTKLFLFRSV